MQVNKNSLKELNLNVAFFLVFAGFYVIILIMAYMGMRDTSRMLTMPVRALIVACLGCAFLLKPRLQLQNGLLFFLMFAVMYYSRIFTELFDVSTDFHIPEIEFFLYFTSFVVLPLVFISQLTISDRDYTALFYAIMIGCFLMAAATFMTYRELIGEVSRLHTSLSDAAISPLILSYTSALGIGVGTGYLLTNNVSGIKKVIIYSMIVLCLLPFFLGASRGSLLALVVPFIFYAFFTFGFKRKVAVITAFVALAIMFTTAAEYLGMGVFNRFMTIGEAIDSGSSSAIRLEIWEAGLTQFLEDPFFGNSLETDEFEFYPHNILIETMITTGIFGFMCYSAFILSVLSKAVNILKNRPSHFFVVIIFLQALVQHMFSGGIYMTSWLAVGAGLILGYERTDSATDQD